MAGRGGNEVVSLVPRPGRKLVKSRWRRGGRSTKGEAGGSSNAVRKSCRKKVGAADGRVLKGQMIWKRCIQKSRKSRSLNIKQVPYISPRKWECHAGRSTLEYGVPQEQTRGKGVARSPVFRVER